MVSRPARLLVYGGVEIKGTRENPVKIISRDEDNPGLGIVIADFKAKNSEVIIENAEFSGLVQAIRFDPFWYRKLVKLDHIEISNFAVKKSYRSLGVGSKLLDTSVKYATKKRLSLYTFTHNKRLVGFYLKKMNGKLIKTANLFVYMSYLVRIDVKNSIE